MELSEFTATLGIIPERTCCFTGHRPSAFYFTDESDCECVRIKENLRREMLSLIDKGVDTFITGMAAGVDTWAGEICASLKDRGIRLIAALPCPEQTKGWSAADKLRYEALLALCDVSVTISEKYTPWCMQQRDRFMVDASKYVIAVYNGADRGGTFYTLSYARKQGKSVALITSGMIY